MDLQVELLELENLAAVAVVPTAVAPPRSFGILDSDLDLSTYVSTSYFQPPETHVRALTQTLIL